MRRGGDGDMPFAGGHARSGVKADPPRTGQIDLGPGVQVGEIVCHLDGPVDRIDVGPELNEIAGDEARGEAKVTERLYQEPGGVAAGAGTGGKRLLRRL